MKPFYHGTIKNVVGAFGALFSDIKIERRFGDSVKGEKFQTIKVPCTYAPKEKWYSAITNNFDRDNQVAYSLPIISYEILGYTYDATRKTNRSMDISCIMEDGKKYVENGSPWNIEFGLYIVSNKTEDVLQIMEQILPIFNPDYTINVRAIDDLDLISPVPISLTSVGIQDDFDGDYTSHRLITYTLTFTAKTILYGRIKSLPIITHVEMGVNDDIKYVFEGDVKTGQITQEIYHDIEIQTE